MLVSLLSIILLLLTPFCKSTSITFNVPIDITFDNKFKSGILSDLLALRLGDSSSSNRIEFYGVSTPGKIPMRLDIIQDGTTSSLTCDTWCSGGTCLNQDSWKVEFRNNYAKLYYDTTLCDTLQLTTSIKSSGLQGESLSVNPTSNAQNECSNVNSATGSTEPPTKEPSPAPTDLPTAAPTVLQICFDSTACSDEYEFSPPFDGEIYGIQLVHTSGDVHCRLPLDDDGSNWGCNNDEIMVVMVKSSDNNVYYPTSTTDGITSISYYNSNLTEVSFCQSGYPQVYSMSNYNANSDILKLIDEENTYTVSTTDVFSLQYPEACCDFTVGDNSGTSCAQLYFYYKSEANPPNNNPNAKSVNYGFITKDAKPIATTRNQYSWNVKIAIECLVISVLVIWISIFIYHKLCGSGKYSAIKYNVVDKIVDDDDDEIKIKSIQQ